MSDSFSDSQNEDWLSIAGRLAKSSSSADGFAVVSHGFPFCSRVGCFKPFIGSPGTASQGVFSAVLRQQFYDDLSPATDKRLHTIIHPKPENDNLSKRKKFVTNTIT